MKKAAPDRLLVWSTEPSVNIKIVPSALRASMVNGLYKSEVSVHAGGLEHPLNAF